MSKKNCTIVGMGRGVSFSVAKRFAREGFTIAMVSRNKERLDGLKQQLNEMGFDAHAYYADAADFPQMKRAFESIKSELGDTDVLVYNVSIYREAKPTQLDAEALVDDFRSNVAGAIVAVQQVADHMKANKTGTILITGGGQALHPIPLLSSLAVGKAGIRNLAYSLHDELKQYGIRVATVTINGQVMPETKFDPDLISEEFWRLYSSKEGLVEKEVLYQ